MKDQPSRLSPWLHLSLVLFSIGLLVVGAWRAREDGSGTSDFDDFWRTARFDVLAHCTITPGYGVHNYLPFFMILMAPLGLLPVKVAAIVFNTISMAAFAASVGITRSWVGPRAAIAAALLVGAYAADCILLGQTALIVGALLVWTWRLAERRRGVIAGGVLALAASIKLFPIVLVLFFVLKRQFRVILGLVLGLIACNAVLPAIVFGPRESLVLHREFWQRSAQNQSLLALAAADSDKMGFANQSLPVILRRLLLPVGAGRHLDGSGVAVSIADWSDRSGSLAGIRLSAIQWLLIALLCGLSIVTIIVTRHPASRLGVERLRLEYAAFVLLSLLLSPVIWTFYLALCYLPLALLAGIAAVQFAGTHRRVSASSAVLALWALATPLLAWPEARAAGLHYWASVLLLITTLLLACRWNHEPQRNG